MKKLIIAEKSSLAKAIAEGIKLIGEVPKKIENYLESESYIITWCVGHLFELKDLEKYDLDYESSKKLSWKETFDRLPFYPEHFEFELKDDPGICKQYKLIKDLCKRADVSAIVNAGDSDREGEIIIRIVLEKAGNHKPVYRLWMPDQTPVTIKYELTHMHYDSEYDNLANAGMARTYIDWLYGINLTRYATVKSNAFPPLKVGRVVTPIVKAIYDRDMEIKNFRPQKYYGVISKEKTSDIEISLNSIHRFLPEEKGKAMELCNKYNTAGAIVKDIKKEEKTISPPKLFSLSKLQGHLAKEYKMSPEKSLATVQKLYEEGYLSYPRTNTEYLAEEEKGKVKAIISILQKLGYKLAFRDSKSIFDNRKIESHSALTPTFRIPDTEKLVDEEKKVYMTVLNRFLAVFSEDSCLVDRTTCVISIGNYEEFTVRADIVKQKGWMQYESNDRKDKFLPELKPGDAIKVKFMPVEKETSPPKHYTVASLLEFLKNPFRKEDVRGEHDDAEEYEAMLKGVELGTEATRTPIISGAIKAGFIELKNNNYLIKPYGCYLIETLEKLHVKMDKENSAVLSQYLKQIYRGECRIDDILEKAKEEINTVFAQENDAEISKFSPEKNIVGKCPKCGKEICKGKKEGNYYCMNKECNFVIMPFRHKPFTEKQAEGMLQGKKILLKNLVAKEKGTKYDIYVWSTGLKEFQIVDGKSLCTLQYATAFPQHKKIKKK